MTQPYIVCPRCGAVSHDSRDVAERYCRTCHRYHDDDQAALVLYTSMPTADLQRWRTAFELDLEDARRRDGGRVVPELMALAEGRLALITSVLATRGDGDE